MNAQNPQDLFAALGALVAAVTALIAALRVLVLALRGAFRALRPLVEYTETPEDDRMVARALIGLEGAADRLDQAQHLVGRVAGRLSLIPPGGREQRKR